jgi:predicted amidohydrolase YtcJ
VRLHAKRWLLSGAIAAVGIAIAAGPAGAEELAPERIYLNARVWTGDAAQPAAEAFAVRGDRFVAVGSIPAIKALADGATEIVDLGGRRVVPGFNDAHWHLPARKDLRLDNAGSVAVVQQRLREYARTLPEGSWVTGRGWMPSDFPERTAHKRYLDEILPDRPVFIRDRDGHQALANDRALQLAGVTRDTPDPADGIIVRDPSGEPTGLLKESAASLVRDLLPPLTPDDEYQMLLGELAAAASFGLTSLQDATEGGLNELERGAVERAIAEGRLTVRYRSAAAFEEQPDPGQLDRYVAACEAARSRLHACGFVKLILDGTVDAKTAVMIEPYVGGGNGLSFVSQQQLDRAVAAYDRAGLQVQIHAIGDGAIRMSLDAFERAARANRTRGRRHRLEHVEVPALADLPRFGQLGVIASTQAIGARPDANMLENYAPLLGPERSARAYAFRLFDDAGAVQAFGSDYPVYPMDPLLGIYTAVTRQGGEDMPAGGWYPQNRLGVEAALAHYTRDAAFAEFAEQEKGTISAGKYADFVVMSRDILAIPSAEQRQTRVLLTVMGGRETFRATGE